MKGERGREGVRVTVGTEWTTVTCGYKYSPKKMVKCKTKGLGMQTKERKDEVSSRGI